MKRYVSTPFFIVACLATFVLYCLVAILRLCGRIRVVGKQNLRPHAQQGTLIFSNHPSYFEPVALLAMLTPRLIFNPPKYFPWFVMDREFYNRWYLWWLRIFRIIPVERESKKRVTNTAAIKKMQDILAHGGVVILFPEGGRTLHCRSYSVTKTGKMIGELRKGAGVLIVNTQPFCIPVWVEGAEQLFPLKSWLPRLWRKTIIRVGNPFQLQEESDIDRATEIVKEKLIGLADESPTR